MVRYFVSQGVPPKSMAAVGFGDRRPVTSGDTEKAKALNRRVELYFLLRKKDKQGE